jgi:hypothetical protein
MLKKKKRNKIQKLGDQGTAALVPWYQGSLLIVRLSYQLDTVRPGCLSTKTLSTETSYQQDLINRDLKLIRY